MLAEPAGPTGLGQVHRPASSVPPAPTWQVSVCVWVGVGTVGRSHLKATVHPLGHTWCYSLPGDVPAEPSRISTSASHPDLLGGWDSWAEAPAPAPATEGTALPLLHVVKTQPCPPRDRGRGGTGHTLVSRSRAVPGCPALLPAPAGVHRRQAPSTCSLPHLLWARSV